MTRGSMASMRPQQFAEEDLAHAHALAAQVSASMRPQQFAEEDEFTGPDVIDWTQTRFNEASAVR